MSEQSPEQILLDEYRRVAGGRTASPPESLVQPVTAKPATSTSAPPVSTKTVLQAMGLPSITSARGTSTSTGQSSRQANQGYTLPVPEDTQPATTSTGSSTLGTIGSTALKLFTGGLGIVPLITGLSGLFSGGKSAAPAPLIPYAMAQSLGIQAANSQGNGSFQLADSSQSGAARAYSPSANSPISSLGQAPQWPAATAGQPSAVTPAAAPGTSSSTPTSSAPPQGTPSSASAAAPQIVVNVSAMDSQSFLDRSSDIAQAVRQAMLSMNSLNDVVSEL